MSLFDRHKVFLYQNYLVYLIAFFIPLIPRIVPIFIVLFGLLSLLAIFKKYSRATLSEESIIMLMLYVIHLIGMMYTENITRGSFDLEVKLSLAAFPIAFTGFKFVNKTNFNRILKYFMAGTFLSLAYSFIQSSVQVFYFDMPAYYFVTSRFSVLFHPSYFSMYLIFSMFIMTYLYWKPLISGSLKYITALTIGYFSCSLGVFLSGSKIGMIMWAAFCIGLLAAFISSIKKKWIPVLLMTILVGLIGGVFQSNDQLKRRVNNLMKVAESEEVDPNTNESSALRVLVYKSVWEIVSDQSWFGQGTGDFQDKLDEVYAKNGYQTALRKHLNTHNLFTQFWIAFGIPGLLLLTSLFIMMFYNAYKKREYVYLGFTLIFFLISLTESAMYVQAGVVFFSYFTVLFSRKAMFKTPASNEHG